MIKYIIKQEIPHLLLQPLEALRCLKTGGFFVTKRCSSATSTSFLILRTFSTESFGTAHGSEVLFLLEVLHLARRRLGSAPTSKGLFSRCLENVSRYESFVRLYSHFFGPFSFRNLREYLLVIYLNSFWYKMYFIHRTFKRKSVDAD